MLHNTLEKEDFLKDSWRLYYTNVCYAICGKRNIDKVNL